MTVSQFVIGKKTSRGPVGESEVLLGLLSRFPIYLRVSRKESSTTSPDRILEVTERGCGANGLTTAMFDYCAS